MNNKRPAIPNYYELLNQSAGDLCRSLVALLIILLIPPIGYSQFASHKSDDGIRGPVKRVIVESSLFTKEEEHFIEGQIRRFVVSTYDLKGRVVKRVQYGPDGSFGPIERYKYSSRGGFAIVEYRDAQGTIILRGYNEYEKNKENMRETLYDIDGTVLSRVKYIYDNAGRVIEIINGEDEYNPVSRQIYRHDELEKNTEVTYYNQDGHPFSRRVKTYDENGNLIRSDHYGLNGAYSGSHIFIYEFDAFGNWIKRTQWGQEEGSGKEPIGVTYRTFLYY